MLNSTAEENIDCSARSMEVMFQPIADTLQSTDLQSARNWFRVRRKLDELIRARRIELVFASRSPGWIAASPAANRAGLPMPRLYLMDNPQPNAFATGRNPQHAAVAATTGLLEMLSRDEIAGVISHELAHIKNRDTLLMTVTATIAGAISMFTQFGMFFGGGHRESNGSSGLGYFCAPHQKR